MNPIYPFPWQVARGLAGAILLDRRRDIVSDAQTCLGLLDPPLQVHGYAQDAAAQPTVLTANHYHRPGFGAWWFVLAITHTLNAPVHWVTANAWTYPDWLRAHTLHPASRWLFKRLARVYGFTAMPPMPPRPHETAERAAAVRRVLAYARQSACPLIGLAPEGMDHPGGVLHWPPPGAGRFMLHLAERGLWFLPIGVYEDGGCLQLHFGNPYRLDISASLAPNERDQAASRVVMEHIAALLPEPLRGEFSS
jgi:hypothetical protein